MHDEGGALARAALDLDRAAMKLEHHGNQVKSDAALVMTEPITPRPSPETMQIANERKRATNAAPRAGIIRSE